jgi:DNA gyrase subunit A
MTNNITPSEKIVDIDLTLEMQESFLEYSYSVIYSRALPDARDGLKPVHRRIVYQMGEMGLRPEKGHVKSARVTGEVMGKLHPHGDSAIYDAMVRMAQDFSLRMPLIDGHGNFGSLDDGPAAARYTEVRLSQAAMLMNEDLDEDVVNFKPNYDAQLTEPEVLPAAFPNLLVNGSAGIAVGMATNMAPHNLRETIAAAIHLLNNVDATNTELMKYVPGPDLPTGGIIVGLDGIRDAYETGRGSFKTRAKVSVESVSPRKLGLVITELPYLVGPEKVIEKIKEGVNNKKLQGISDVTDLTDRSNGLKLVIGLKTGFDPEVVLDLLYRFTPMEDSFGINNVALVHGRPQTLGLRDLLGVFLAHRITVTRRRSENRLGKKKARLHLVEGLLKAILEIDEVIRIIRSSDEVEQARTNLMGRFSLSEIQAEYILELRLRRLTKFSKLELDSEAENLAKEIEFLEKLLGSDSLLKALVAEELQAVADKYGDARRTQLLDESGEVKAVSNAKAIASGAELADTECSILLTSSGLLGRTPSYVASQPSAKRKRHDAVAKHIETTTRKDVGFLTSAGRMLRIHAGDIPPVGETFDPSGAIKATEFLGLRGEERLVDVFDLSNTDEIALATAQGTIKRVNADYPAKDEFEMITLKEGDRVVGASTATDAKEYILITSDAQLLRFDASSVRATGRAAAGITGINLSEGAQVISFGKVSSPEGVQVITAAKSGSTLSGIDGGSLKRSALTEFPSKGRATGGVRAHKFIRDEDHLYFACVIAGESLGASADGKPIDLEAIAPAKRDASGSTIEIAIASVGTR